MSRPERALITGANRGLGLEFVRSWLEAGKEVYALARDPMGSEGLQSLAGDYRDRSGTVKRGYAILGLVCERATDSVFVKMIGPAEEVAAERERFLAFAKSLTEV